MFVTKDTTVEYVQTEEGIYTPKYDTEISPELKKKLLALVKKTGKDEYESNGHKYRTECDMCELDGNVYVVAERRYEDEKLIFSAELC